MSYLVISASLNPKSKSRVLAQISQEDLIKQGAQSALLDLSDHSLPLCDGDQAYDHPDVEKIAASIRSARGVLLAMPIYNYYGNAAAKNLIELTGSAWEHKVVGFLCAAGGQGSYMSVMSLANSLMLDFRCLILPRFVYATGEAFEDGKLTDTKIINRIAGLTKTLVKVSNAVNET